MLDEIPNKAANYLRLGVQFGSGLIALPLITHAIGTDGWAFVSLFIAGIGLAGLLQDFVRIDVYRNLASADRVGDDIDFLSAWQSAVGLTVCVAALAVCVFMGLTLSVERAVVGGDLAIRGGIITPYAGFVAVNVATALCVHALIYKRRLALANFIIAGERFGLLTAATAIAAANRKLPESIQMFGWVWLLVATAFTATGFICLVKIDKRCWPLDMRISPRDVSVRIRNGLDQFSVTAADGLAVRAASMIIYWTMGITPWCALYGYARQIAGYVYQAGIGVVLGVEGSASAAAGDKIALRDITSRNLTVQTILICPLVYVSATAGPDLIRCFVGTKADPLVLRYSVELGHAMCCFAAGFAVKAMVAGLINAVVGIGLRAKYSKSFVAVAFTSIGAILAVSVALPPAEAFIAIGYIFLTQNILQAVSVLGSTAWKAAGVPVSFFGKSIARGCYPTVVATLFEHCLLFEGSLPKDGAVGARLAAFTCLYTTALIIVAGCYRWRVSTNKWLAEGK